jgi:hypothetical protein
MWAENDGGPIGFVYGIYVCIKEYRYERNLKQKQEEELSDK